MTDLPPIPDAAIDAALRDMGYTDSMIGVEHARRDDTPEIRQIIEAALPHLTAATLRWAADKIDRTSAGVWIDGDWLRRLADEVTP